MQRTPLPQDMNSGCQYSAAAVGLLKKTAEEARGREGKGEEEVRKRSSSIIREEEEAMAATGREGKGEEQVGKRTRRIIMEEEEAKKARRLLREAVSVGVVSTVAWLLVWGCCTAAVLVMLMLLMLTPGKL